MFGQISCERVSELGELVALPTEVFSFGRVQRQRVDVVGAEQRSDLPLRDPAAFVVRQPKIEWIAAQLGYHFFRCEFSLAGLDEHDPDGGEQAHAVARLPTAAAQPLRRLTSLL